MNESPLKEAESEKPTWRPSGVRRAVASVSDVLADVAGAPPDQVLARVPRVATDPRGCALDARARWLVAFVDGRSTFEEVVTKSGLPAVDGLLGACELVALGVVVLA
jgi:hypothetical protein